MCSSMYLVKSTFILKNSAKKIRFINTQMAKTARARRSCPEKMKFIAQDKKLRKL